MIFFTAVLSLLILPVLGSVAWTFVLNAKIEKANPPIGQFANIDGTKLHYLDLLADRPDPNTPVIVFIHGASSNLKDQLLPPQQNLQGQYRMIFVDRPGHGWSSRGDKRNNTPLGQAQTIAGLLDHLDIGKAIIVGHSFGGAVTAAFPLVRPDLVSGLLFLSPATHPWPGGATNWYNKLAKRPILGRIFSWTLAGPAGLGRLPAAVDCVFSPNKPPENYLAKTGIELVLTPRRFRDNAIDVEGLYDNVLKTSPRYKTITAPTIIITGDSDTVVYEEIHSEGLARDIAGAKLIVVKNLGHKPDYVVPELVAAAIDVLAGKTRDLNAIAQAAEQRIASDRFGPVERCPQPKMPQG